MEGREEGEGMRQSSMLLSLARYYNAVVDMLSGDGDTCTVTFDGYGTTVIVRLSDLRPRGWEEEEEEGGGAKKKKLDARPNAK